MCWLCKHSLPHIHGNNTLGEGDQLEEGNQLEEGTHRNLRPTGVAAVEAELHHVGALVHVTFAVGVNEVEGGGVDASVLQQTSGQSHSGRVLRADCRLA